MWEGMLRSGKMLVCRFVRQYSLRAMSRQLIIHDVWIGSIVLQVALALALLATRAWRNFPAFAAYIFFCLFEAGIRYALFGNKKAYFCAFWICEAIGIVLGLAVVREIFTKVFSPHPALRKLATIIFRVAVIALVLLACAVIYVQSATPEVWSMRAPAGRGGCAPGGSGINYVLIPFFLCFRIALAPERVWNSSGSGNVCGGRSDHRDLDWPYGFDHALAF